MKFIESPWTDPYYNLALEEYVFEKLDRSEDWLILWQNYNTIVIGKYQNTIEVNQCRLCQNAWHLGRAPSVGWRCRLP